LRQSRLQVASEIAQTQVRINQEDERLWVLRAKIAERVTPEQVERLADGIELRPLVPPVVDEKYRAEQDKKLAVRQQPGGPDFVGPMPRVIKQATRPPVRQRGRSQATNLGGNGRVARAGGR
jgi:hypothetical protein